MYNIKRQAYGSFENEMDLKWLEVSCTCFKWTVCIPNDVHVLEITGTCWKWANNWYVLKMSRTCLKWSVRIDMHWKWRVCIGNDPYVFEMIHTYWKWPVWSVCIQNRLEMNCTYWWDCRKLLNGWKKIILIWLSITRFKRVQTDLYGKFGIKNNARVRVPLG